MNQWKSKQTYKGLTQDRVVHHLKKIYFKIIFYSCILTSDEADVVFQAWWLIEQWNTMNVDETQSQFQVQFPNAVVDDAVHFVA